MSTANPSPTRPKPADPTVSLRRQGRHGVDALAQTGITPTSTENAALQILALRPEVEQGLINDQAKQAVKARLFGDAEAPSMIGRFKVIRELGRGGTGIVYIAYDVELDRKIAVKLLNNERPDEQTGSANARLLREAQAMARVSHPNIAAVHEVGMFRGQIYVAMEFVLGQTLAAWLRPGRRWQDVLAVFRQAAAGLAAAHDAGLVHRDFKPANAILGEDNRLRVLDFGLARADAAPGGIAALDRTDEGNGLALDPATSASDPEIKLDLSLTVTGTVLGTPAYMSPEQFLGQRIDAKSDQFSFCVALYEALYGERPFDGDTLSSLMAAVLAGKVRETPSSARIPRWLRAAVLRGLRNDPEQRWPSMHALAKAITPDHGQARGSIFAALGLGVALTAGATSWLGTADAAAQVCSGASEQLAGVWDDARKDQVRRAMLATGAAGAAQTFARVEERLDAYAADWVAAHGDACAATNVRKEQSSEVMDQRMTCLAERRHALVATVNVLAGADRQIAENAVDAAAGLPAVDRCNELEYVRRQVKPPDDPNAATRVEGARALLKEADAREKVGKFVAALDLVEQAAGSVKDIDYPPLAAEIALRRGTLLELASEYGKSRPALEEAYFTAVSIGHLHVAIDAAVALVLVTGRRLSTPDVMQMWSRHAEALLKRGGDDLQRARLSAHRGLGAHLVPEYGASLERQRKAREFYEAALKTYREHGLHLEIGRLEIAVGETYEWDRSTLPEAERHFRAAIDEFAIGACDEHPGVALSRTSLGWVMRMQGRLDEAEAEFEKAGELIRQTVGVDHRNYGFYLAGLADVHMGRKDWAAAEPLLRRAYELHLTREGADHVNTRSAHLGLGRVLVELHRYAEAAALLEELVAGLEASKNFDPHALAKATMVYYEAHAGLRRGAEVASRIQAVYDRVTADLPVEGVEPVLLYALALTRADAGDEAAARELVLRARSNAEAMHEDSEYIQKLDDWLAHHPARK